MASRPRKPAHHGLDVMDAPWIMENSRAIPVLAMAIRGTKRRTEPMRRPTILPSLVAAAGLMSLASCSGPPTGQVPPMTGGEPPGVVVIDDPTLAQYLDIPGGQQNYSYNALGFLEYNTR